MFIGPPFSNNCLNVVVNCFKSACNFVFAVNINVRSAESGGISTALNVFNDFLIIPF